MTTRLVASLVLTGALSLLAAAGCGDGSSPRVANTATTTTESGLLAFARCMRLKGVPTFPDPEAHAANAKSPGARELRVGSAQLSAAENACQHLLPAGIDDRFPAAEVQLLLPGMRRFSQCMRSYGVSNWPDPTTDSEGRPLFQLSAHGFTRQQAHSPRITHDVVRCQHVLPSALGGMPAG